MLPGWSYSSVALQYLYGLITAKRIGPVIICWWSLCVTLVSTACVNHVPLVLVSVSTVPSWLPQTSLARTRTNSTGHVGGSQYVSWPFACWIIFFFLIKIFTFNSQILPHWRESRNSFSWKMRTPYLSWCCLCMDNSSDVNITNKNILHS